MPTQTTTTAPRRSWRPLRDAAPLCHVATVTGHQADTDALVLVTCTCRRLRTAVDADDEVARNYVLVEHLQRHAEADDLPVRDTRTGHRSVLTRADAPDLILILNPPRKDVP